ncbi:hypothetical protein MIR68_006927 [Amoeboaphelidium protococcarum]|nr:hypothetical protein MIR68_006927 [Amoeboaphelidium protococcarum]
MLSGPSYKSEEQTILVRVNSDVGSYVSESDVESLLSMESLDIEVGSDDDTATLMNAKLLANRAFLDAEIARWEMVDSTLYNSDDFKIVKKPTASQMHHLVLNPFLYRGLQPIATLDDLAGLVGAPSHWSEICDQKVMGDVVVDLIYRDFVGLDESTSEIIVESMFERLVNRIGDCLGTLIYHRPQIPFIVGGILARSQYDIRGRSDTIFQDRSQNFILATECKKASAFAADKLWHHGSRGIQTFSTMYRTGCPTILFSQKAFKLFVENESRNAVLTWPVSSDQDTTGSVPFSLDMVAASYSVEYMSSNIKKVIAICLMASVSDGLDSTLKKAAAEKMTPVKNSVFTSKDAQTGEQGGKKRKLGGDKEWKLVRSARLRAVTPKFISGFVDELPVYTTIRVGSDDLIQQMAALDVETD